MYNLLINNLKKLKELKDPIHTRQAALGIFRITMQHACITLGEWIVFTLRKNPNLVSNITPIDLKKFPQPPDGDLVHLLSQLLVAVENLGWRSAGSSYWNKETLSAHFHLLPSLKNVTQANVETVLLAYVANRNDGAEGHGLPGSYNKDIDISVLELLIEKIKNTLPVINKKEDILLLPAPLLKPLVTLKLYNGRPICYRHIKKSAAGRVQVNAQIQKTLLAHEPITYEAENILLDLPQDINLEYRIYEPSWDNTWKPFTHIPDRLTSRKVFTGRAQEIISLSEWADDFDSRKCMVWGDGGVGKTTLVVEFLHRLLDGETEVTWRPEIITFYTAKKTRWGLQGLEQISAQDIGVVDVALDIARMLTKPNLDRSWFDKNPREIINKLASLQKEMNINRSDHLIILDNTETMASNETDVKALALQINDLSKHVGRVILTSRRREHIEAYPLQTENWSEEEGAEFLKKRGEDLNCISIQQAGLATLKRHSRTLINKPIALEVFVQAASAAGASLENAFQRVQRMQRRDLGQFLYEDAWGRLTPELRHVLLLMNRIGDSHDQFLLQLCCQKAEVSVAAAIEAIEESKGIASLTRFEGVLQITFTTEFSNYCTERWELIKGEKAPTNTEIDWVKRRHSEFLKSASSQVYDRNIQAFRVPAAKAAWQSFKENRLDDAIELYETACHEDSENGLLFDRYAYTLMKHKDFPKALEKSKQAAALLPNHPDVYFTKGMILARLGEQEEAIVDLNKAHDLGKPKHLCELQKAYAYVYSSPPVTDLALKCINKAKSLAPKDRFIDRFMDEVSRFQRNWLA